MIEWHGSDCLTLGNRIVAMWVSVGLRQIDLARRLGMSKLELSEIERGLAPCSMGMLTQIAAALGIPYRELLGEAPAP